VLIIPARVQGEGSVAEIVAGIRTANRLKPAPDVLVVGRGGGSLEDLWSFNEEAVVRAIAASRIPTISAVGHEIDVTLSDLVADVRALTPSEAAERVVPAADELAARLRHHRERLRVASLRRLNLARTRLAGIASQRPFRRPFDIVHDRSRRLDELALRGAAGLRGLLHARQRRFANLAGKLQSLSPLSVLERGYSITQDAKTGKVIRSVGQVRTDQAIVTKLLDGTVTSRVEAIDK
jgi:exodeoxyribonuclease VII large subunit